MSYRRVIPRDLFNEAKLLKCYGRLALLVHDGMADPLTFKHDGEPFDIHQDESDGGLFVGNVKFEAGKEAIVLKTAYGSKDPYPLFYVDGEGVESRVFYDDGRLTDDFKKFVELTATRSVDPDA